MFFESPDRQDRPLYCRRYHMCLSVTWKEIEQACHAGSYVCFGSHVGSHLSEARIIGVIHLPNNIYIEDRILHCLYIKKVEIAKIR